MDKHLSTPVELSLIEHEPPLHEPRRHAHQTTKATAAAARAALALHIHLQGHLCRLLDGGLLASARRDIALRTLLVEELFDSKKRERGHYQFTCTGGLRKKSMSEIEGRKTRHTLLASDMAMPMNWLWLWPPPPLPPVNVFSACMAAAAPMPLLVAGDPPPWPPKYCW